MKSTFSYNLHVIAVIIKVVMSYIKTSQIALSIKNNVN